MTISHSGLFFWRPCWLKYFNFHLKVKKVITRVKIFLLLTPSILTLSLLHKECGPLCEVERPYRWGGMTHSMGRNGL